MTRRALRTAVLALVAMMALTGCEVSGTVVVRSSDAVALDLTVKGDDYYLPCDAAGWGAAGLQLGFNEFVDYRGETTCRVFGTVHPELVRDYLQVSQPGEYVEAASNPLSMAPGRAAPIGSVWSSPRTKLDLTVTFPGRVLSSTGEISGNVVHFGDPRQYVRPYGLRATALSHPGPEWSVLGPVVGIGAGIGLAALWSYLRRQRRRHMEMAALAKAAGSTPPDSLSSEESVAPEPPPARSDDEQAFGQPVPLEVESQPGRVVAEPARTAGEDDRWAPPHS